MNIPAPKVSHPFLLLPLLTASLLAVATKSSPAAQPKAKAKASQANKPDMWVVNPRPDHCHQA